MDLQDLILTNLAAIIGAFVSIKVSIAKLEVKVGTLGTDVDNIAYIIGTKRAIKTKEEQGDQNVKLGSTL